MFEIEYSPNTDESHPNIFQLINALLDVQYFVYVKMCISEKLSKDAKCDQDFLNEQVELLENGALYIDR